MTFSIVARDENGAIGSAVCSSSPAVAARCLHLEGGVGGVNSQNITDPRLGAAILDRMRGGGAAEEALRLVADSTEHIAFRQLLVVDAAGNSAAYSGAKALGNFSDARGAGVAAGGNMLASLDIPQIMVDAFLASNGELETRLLAAMKVAVEAGGEAGPVHSAGLSVVRDAGWRVTDLRVDWTDGDPVGELEALLAKWIPQRDDYVNRGLNPSVAPRTEFLAMSEASSVLKASLAGTVAESSEALIALSETLHANPETAWEEHRAAAWVGDVLATAGFRVEPRYLGFETAFLAEAGSGPVTIGLMAEYDALPGLGHACGHNLIAASSVGAGIALARVADDLGVTIRVYGTPAEEGGGGKIELLRAGAFSDLDFAMMVHPGPVDVAEARPFAVAHNHITYEGVSAHAAAYPDQGVNANDAFIIAQVALGLLRQQLPADTRVHGIQTIGGYAPNAIPEHTEGRWYTRASTLEQLTFLEERVRRCFEAGALATGATLKIEPESEPYAEFATDERALAAYKRNALERGRVFADPNVAGRMNRASTDMGNVSQIVPAIHPYIGVDSLPFTNHQKEFAAACVGAKAERALLDAATIAAWTVADLVADGVSSFRGGS